MDFNKSNPILLAKIKTFSSGRAALIYSEGELDYIQPNELTLLASMDGYLTWQQIAENTGTTTKEVKELFIKFSRRKAVTLLKYWNKLRWCSKCGAYLNSFEEDCWQCGQRLTYVPLAPPNDPWICFFEEKKFIFEIIFKQLGLRIPEHILILGNNGLRHGRFFWQIIIYGQVVATIHFDDIEPSTWHVEPEDCLESIVNMVHNAKIVSWEEDVQKTMVANSRHMDKLIQDSLVFIEEMNSHWEATPLIYFSGGKESLVMSYLFKTLNCSANLVYAGVGFDFPEERAFIEELQRDSWLSSKQKLFADFGNSIQAQKELDKNGPITLENTWCRKTLKYPNRDKLVTMLYPDSRFIAYEGSRWYETDFRRSHARVQLMNIPGYSQAHYWALPLASWTSLDIWCYTFANKLPINPLYKKGFQRTTCWICPLINPFHIQQSMRQEPHLWKKVPIAVPTILPDTDFRRDVL